MSPPSAIVLVLVISILMGAVNGVLSSYGRIPSFIVTLATLSIYRGIAFLFNDGSPIFSVSTSLEPWFYGKLFGIALPFFYVLIIYAMAWGFLKYTPSGRRIYAIGGNESAARLSGINVNRTRLIAFVIAGLMAGIAVDPDDGPPEFRLAQLRRRDGAAGHRGRRGRRRQPGRRIRAHPRHPDRRGHHRRRPERSESERRSDIVAEHHPGRDHRPGGLHRHVAGRLRPAHGQGRGRAVVGRKPASADPDGEDPDIDRAGRGR